MVTVKCQIDECDLKDLEFNVLGQHETVECGCCGSQLKATDQRPDPEGVNFDGFTN
jgi:hypothetical protein